MRKWWLTLFFLLFMVIVAGCDAMQQPRPYVPKADMQSEAALVMQGKLMETREVIREAAIGVEAVVFRSGFLRAPLTQTGSGYVFYEDENYYYALTNHHVVDRGSHPRAEYTVTLFYRDGANPSVSAELLFKDDAYDLAVLRFAKGTHTIPVRDISTRLNAPLKAGEMLLAVGNPSGINMIVTFGEFLSITTIESVAFPVIFHSVMIFSGHSGGALTDLDGNLVGINAWGNSTDNSSGLAVPLAKIMEFLENHDFIVNYFETTHTDENEMSLHPD
ncbi:MAG: serine protease [Acholeplasmatales bacterium]|nr:MAG: serine protease [Acholeplasmatales bacterium]